MRVNSKLFNKTTLNPGKEYHNIPIWRTVQTRGVKYGTRYHRGSAMRSSHSHGICAQGSWGHSRRCVWKTSRGPTLIVTWGERANSWWREKQTFNGTHAFHKTRIDNSSPTSLPTRTMLLMIMMSWQGSRHTMDVVMIRIYRHLMLFSLPRSFLLRGKVTRTATNN